MNAPGRLFVKKQSLASNIIGMVGLTLLGTGTATYFLQYRMEKHGKVLRQQNYVADTLDVKTPQNTISQQDLDNEVSKMLQQAESANKNYEMVRVPRPLNDGPNRSDMIGGEQR